MISSMCQNQTADSDSELTPFSGATGAPQWVGCVRHCQPFSTFHCERVPTLWFRSLPFHWLFCGISNLLGWQSHPMPVAMGSWGSSGLLRAFSQSKSPLFCADGGWEVTGGHLSLILSLSRHHSLSIPPALPLQLSRSFRSPLCLSPFVYLSRPLINPPLSVRFSASRRNTRAQNGWRL